MPSEALLLRLVLLRLARSRAHGGSSRQAWRESPTRGCVTSVPRACCWTPSERALLSGERGEVLRGEEAHEEAHEERELRGGGGGGGGREAAEVAVEGGRRPRPPARVQCQPGTAPCVAARAGRS